MTARAARWALALAAVYAAAFAVTRVLWWAVLQVRPEGIHPLVPAGLPAFMIAFAVFFLPLLYLFNSALLGQRLRIQPPKLVLYMGVTFFCALWAEIGADSLFVAVIGRPCWTYETWPVHHGFTSGVGTLMWPMYGFFLYGLHQAIDGNPRLVFLRPRWAKAVLVGVDAMLLEVAANAFALGGFGTWFFHYHAPDLLHFTTWEVFVPYVITAYVGLSLLHAVETRLPHVPTGAALYAAGLLSLWLV
ncbi:MAG: hypothetical protein HY904_07600 [Deltaproteobacteria bacterium]|nr:hypothetical protein [Deltaproteobacteria bacterium]